MTHNVLHPFVTCRGVRSGSDASGPTKLARTCPAPAVAMGDSRSPELEKQLLGSPPRSSLEHESARNLRPPRVAPLRAFVLARRGTKTFFLVTSLLFLLLFTFSR